MALTHDEETGVYYASAMFTALLARNQAKLADDSVRHIRQYYNMECTVEFQKNMDYAQLHINKAINYLDKALRGTPWET